MATVKPKRFKCPAHWTREQRMAHYTQISPTGCVLWTGRRNTDGYGQLTVKGNTQAVHRFAWEAVNGPVPSGMCVCHRCDTPACVNPDHLFLGTHAENMADRNAKGRQVAHKGISHPQAKLTVADVIAIRAAAGRYRDIGIRYGITATSVMRIKKRENWAHIP